MKVNGNLYVNGTILHASAYLADTGSADAYVVSFPNQTLSTLTDGLQVYFQVANTNTGASTITVNGVGPFPIKKMSQDLAANDLIAGEFVELIFDGTEVFWRLLTSTASNYIYNNTAFVHPDGDNLTAVIGNFNKPFSTINAAIDNIILNMCDNPVVEVWPKKGLSNSPIDINTPASTYDYTIHETIETFSNWTLSLKPGVKIKFEPDSPTPGVNPMFSINDSSKLTIIGADKNSCSIEQRSNGTTGTIQILAVVRRDSTLYIENVNLYCDPQFNTDDECFGIYSERNSLVYLKNVIYTMTDENITSNISNKFAQFYNVGGIIRIDSCILKLIYVNATKPVVHFPCNFNFNISETACGQLHVSNTKIVNKFDKIHCDCIVYTVPADKFNHNIIWDNNYAYNATLDKISTSDHASVIGSFLTSAAGMTIYIYYVARSIHNYEIVYNDGSGGSIVEKSGRASSMPDLNIGGFGLNESYELIAPHEI